MGDYIQGGFYFAKVFDMDNNGYIKLHRSILKWEWWGDENTVVVFLYLLLNANWKESRYRGHVIPKGGLVVGLNSLSESLGISVQSIRTALNHLKSTGEITIKSTNKFSIVTIANWEKYQGCDDEPTSKSTSKLTNKQQTTNKQLTTEEEYNNIRIEEDNNISSKNSSPDYEGVINLYHECCPSLPKVKSLTDERKKFIKARLKDYSVEDVEKVFKAAEESDFLRNGNGTWNGADFTWIMRPNNFVKILEGNYRNKDTQTDKQKNSQAKGYQNGSNADFLKMLEDESRAR